MKIKTVYLLFVFALLPSTALSQDVWALEKDSDGVKVYSRLEAGSPYKSFKAITLADAPSQAIVGLLQDVNGYASWFAFTEKAKLLGSGLHEQYVYMETRFPWPFNNEDMIYKMTFAAEENAITIVTLQGIASYLPPVKGVVRMKGAKGYISLKAIGNKTEITYAMHSEPGGDIPPWMANQYLHNLPFLTLSKLKKLASACRIDRGGLARYDIQRKTPKGVFQSDLAAKLPDYRQGELVKKPFDVVRRTRVARIHPPRQQFHQCARHVTYSGIALPSDG